MPTKRPIHEKIQENEQEQCQVKGCFKSRHRIEAYCKNHAYQRRYWGHPEAHRIRKSDYSVESDQVRAIIMRNIDHPGINLGIEFFERWLKRASQRSPHVPCPELISRLHDAGVSPVDLLVEMAALWVLGYQDRGLVKSDLHLTYLLGSKLIRFVPYPVNLKGTVHHKCGQYIRDNIGVLLMNILRSVEKKEVVKDEASRVMGSALF
ncbi:hypothetical protein C4544_01995 [candidate division WS5 bacterium]|uniref:Uncharacterized protein n=1 Tax=candidate division WS5 bacterium TaxID=2093353 RepID=A0A419DEZ5_9BACT|nr:MAG: hypothetical protein C4544_01995 [candidate division WS5 bacterium]